MTDEEEALLVEQVASAYRPPARTRRCAITPTLEAALDPDGLSTAARAILARIP